jgi:hypothetical protein
MSLAMHANSKLKDLNYDIFVLNLFLAFQPHLTVMFYLNSPLSLILMVTLIKYNEWKKNMMAMHGTRLR